MMDYIGYEEFLESKRTSSAAMGFEPGPLNPLLYDWQTVVTRWFLRQGRAAALEDCGLGKGQPEGAMILTPTGFAPNTTLGVGDLVVSANGVAYPLGARYDRGLQECFRVHFSDGASYVVDADHLHIVRTNNDRYRRKPWRVVSTRRLMDTLPIRYGSTGKSRNLDIPLVAPVQMERREHWIHPYIVGVLLGDGCITRRCTVTIADAEILETVQALLPMGWTLTHKVNYDYRISYGGSNKRDFIRELRRLGILGTRSSTKFVPAEYLYDSVDNRVWLLRGLMDTDGWIKDTSQYYSTSRQLADDVLSLIRSLGGAPTRALKKPSCMHKGTMRQGKPCHVLTFSLKTFNPFHLSRKAKKWNPHPRDNGRWIDRIEPVGEMRTICLSVGSPDQSYVTENHIVTHNTPQQLAWAAEVARYTGEPVLIVAPLGVAAQTVAEGVKFGVEVHRCQTDEQARDHWKAPRVLITNYERLKGMEETALHCSGVVLDESGILKSFMGKTKRMLVSLFCHTPYRLCCTATPAPNDYLELGNHCEFLGIMPSCEMISRWFINDLAEAGKYRLKGHAAEDYWRWVASWAVAMGSPADLGYSDDGYVLPPLKLIHEHVDTDAPPDALFHIDALSSTEMHKVMRQTAPARAERAGQLVREMGDESVILWCNTNYEADALMKFLPTEGTREIRGSDSTDEKEAALAAFSSGEVRRLVTKPRIAGFGMNWQHCAREIFVGLSYSYEQLYQSLRRCWRFGQTREVHAHIISTAAEGSVVAAIERKREAHVEMQRAMIAAMREAQMENVRSDRPREEVRPIEVRTGEDWRILEGDCVQGIKTLPADSVGISIFSPPFSNLYIYSDSIADMGNTADDEEFFRHFDYLIPELLRVTIPGRLCCIHCKDLPLYRGRDGAAGLRDFPGEIIRAMEDHGWTYHSRVTVWKCPVTEMTRTKNQGLLYKQIRKDSTYSRQGMADYVLTFRKWGFPEGQSAPDPVPHTHEEFPLPQWQQLASPVWTLDMDEIRELRSAPNGRDETYPTDHVLDLTGLPTVQVWHDIRQTLTLNTQSARGDKDEKHICPLQLELIARCLRLWSKPGDTVLSPFAGIGSEGYVALLGSRKFIGCELKAEYVQAAARNLNQALASRKVQQAPLFAPEQLNV